MPDTKYMKYKNNNLTFAKTSNANELKHGLEIESQGFESSQIMGPFQIVFIGIYQTNMLLQGVVQKKEHSSNYGKIRLNHAPLSIFTSGRIIKK